MKAALPTVQTLMSVYAVFGCLLQRYIKLLYFDYSSFAPIRYYPLSQGFVRVSIILQDIDARKITNAVDICVCMKKGSDFYTSLNLIRFYLTEWR